tara:strand:- start:131 stop:337 length:207 start_codon:yes stop_codon:yes gene_type:complete
MKTFVTEERETPYRVLTDRQFFADDIADAQPTGYIVAFNHPIHYLEDQEILGLANHIRNRVARTRGGR